MRGALHELFGSRIKLFLQVVRVFIHRHTRASYIEHPCPARLLADSPVGVGLPGSRCDN